MQSVFYHIFKSLGENEAAMKNVQKTLRGQTRLNRYYLSATALITANIVLTYYRDKQRDEEIQKLKEEIKELRGSEGE